MLTCEVNSVLPDLQIRPYLVKDKNWLPSCGDSNDLLRFENESGTDQSLNKVVQKAKSKQPGAKLVLQLKSKAWGAPVQPSDAENHCAILEVFRSLNHVAAASDASETLELEIELCFFRGTNAVWSKDKTTERQPHLTCLSAPFFCSSIPLRRKRWLSVGKLIRHLSWQFKAKQRKLNVLKKRLPRDMFFWCTTYSTARCCAHPCGFEETPKVRRGLCRQLHKQGYNEKAQTTSRCTSSNGKSVSGCLEHPRLWLFQLLTIDPPFLYWQAIHHRN